MSARRGLPLFALLAFLALDAGAVAEVVIPYYWDTRRRIDRPNLPAQTEPFRILTAPDFPPFNFLDGNGEPTGFNVDLARAICAELRIACTIQARAFDTLLPSLREGQGDAVIAGVGLTRAARREFEVGEVYLRSPARFVVRQDSPLTAFEPEALPGRRIGVEAGTAHAAFLETYFSTARILRFPGPAEARNALRRGEIDALFGDAVALAFWLNGTASENCCAFRGGPYLESRFFGEGYAIVLRPGADPQRRAMDHALQRLAERGTFAELYLRWFPIGLY